MGADEEGTLEALADAGGVLVSNTVHDHVRDRLPFAFEVSGLIFRWRAKHRSISQILGVLWLLA
jgi:hypothetical protein